MQKLKTNCII